MNTTKSNFCKFCLNTAPNQDLEVIEDVIRDTLNNFTLEPILTKNDAICNSCLEKTTDFLNFKSTCLYVEDKINDLIDPKQFSQPYLNEFFPEEKVDKSVLALSRGETVCRFCLSLEVEHCKNLHSGQDEIMFILNMVNKHIPQMNLAFTKEPVACEQCYNFLEGFFNHIKACSYKRNKINNHFESKVTPTELDNVKIKKENFENNEYIVNVEIKKEMSTDVGDQNDEIRVIEVVTANDSDMTPIFIKKEEGEEIFEAQQSDSFHSEDLETSTCDTPKRKTSVQKNRPPNNHSKQRKHKCSLCDFTTARRYTLKTHLLVHVDASEAKMLKCEVCDFTTKWKGSLKTHMITHKSPSEAKMHKCNLCDFETKYNSTIKEHMATHLDPSERTTYHCSSCDFKTTRKYNLKVHVSEHENPSQIKMLWCEICGFKTKWKRSLASHLLTHKDPLEVKTYKCDYCSLETRHSSVLKRHMVTHTHPSQSRTFSCGFCDFTTKWRFSLKKHSTMHETPERAETFTCEVCGYRTGRKGSLRVHALSHKQPSDDGKSKVTRLEPKDVPTYKCELCDFTTTRKDSLKAHGLVHADPSEVETFRCELCGFETKRKGSLGKHVSQVHRVMTDTCQDKH